MRYEWRGEQSILFLGDILVFFCALWTTLLLRYLAIPSEDLFYNHFVPFSFLALVWVVVFFIVGLYDQHTEFLKRELPGMILSAQVANSVIAATFFFFIPYFGITPKTTLLIYLVVSSALLLAWRLLLVEHITPRTQKKALLIGEGEEVEELIREVNKNRRYGFEFVRSIDFALLKTTPDVEGRLIETIKDAQISVIVADVHNTRLLTLAPLFFALTFKEKDIRFIDFGTMYEHIFDRVPVSLVKHDWFLTYASEDPHPFYDVVKRGIDIVGGLLCACALLLIFPFVWLCIKYEDGGSIFITQRRMGIRNTTIEVYKFRTMTANEHNVWLGESKNTVTRVGSFLRKTSLDELPQVLNILRGEMSLIGPRNDIAGLAERLKEEIPFYSIRTLVKPGITGWAQTHQRYTPGNISPQSVLETRMRLAYDLFYIKHRSLLLDINIALRTIKTLLSRFGINIRLR